MFSRRAVSRLGVSPSTGASGRSRAARSAVGLGTAEEIDQNIIRLLAKAKTLAAFSYKNSMGQPFIYPRNDLT